MTFLAPAVVYLLCLATSIICAGLLVRTYLQNRSRLLLWTAVAFGLLALNNFFLVLDMLVFAEVDLRLLRHASAGAAVIVLIYGFISESD